MAVLAILVAATKIVVATRACEIRAMVCPLR